MASSLIRLIAAVMFVAASSPAAAQTRESPTEPARASELGVLLGGWSSGATAAVSGVAGWELNRWTTLEARGTWLAPTGGADGFSADLGALFNVVARRTLTPFVGAGFGMYRAGFDATARRMPAFYRHRVPDAARNEPLAFTDPAFRLAAGVDIVTRRSLSIRPEASSVIVWRDGRSDAIALAGIRFGYRFEDKTVR